MTKKTAKPSLDDEVQSALKWLKSHSTKATLDGMARYAIPSDKAFGVTVKDIKALGKKLGRNHGLVLVERAAADERNFVKKGVNMALRAIGRRNRALNAAAVAVARRLADSHEAAARWVGRDALRDLTSPAVTKRLKA